MHNVLYEGKVFARSFHHRKINITYSTFYRMKGVYGFLEYLKTRIYGFVSNCERVTLLLRRFTLLDTLLEIASYPKEAQLFRHYKAFLDRWNGGTCLSQKHWIEGIESLNILTICRRAQIGQTSQ